MIIREVRKEDFEELYELGKKTPELRVSATEDFMDADEFRWAMGNSDGVFLIAEGDHEIAGFVYANTKDTEKTLVKKWACLVYIAVRPEYRKEGIATQLYKTCIQRLKEKGVTHLYGWADIEGDGGILSFMKKQGFSEGHKYAWMDKEL